MKMRKLLPLVLLAVGALFMLSGCDAMLDAIFQNDVINLDVWALGSTHADFAYAGATQNLVVMDSSFTIVANITQSFSSFDGSYVHYYFTVNKLKDGTYYMTTYYRGPLTFTHAATSTIYDTSWSAGMPSITFPNTSLGDSTGHTVNVVMLAP
jgi:hypothetical protein